jgi:hypothetical protein
MLGTWVSCEWWLCFWNSILTYVLKLKDIEAPAAKVAAAKAVQNTLREGTRHPCPKGS